MITLAKLRCAIDVLRGRLPGALAMIGADKDPSISIRWHPDGQISCQVEFYFNHDHKAASRAYAAIERIYEMDRPQQDARP